MTARKSDQEPGSTAAAAERQRLERAFELYLEDCYARRTAARVSECADYLGISRPHLSRATRRVAGQTAREYLRGRQLAHAKRLLAASPYATTEQIALASAFGTRRTFERIFRHAFGLSPDAYRDEITKCR
jgi:AraC-like DNA-binding protein